MHLSGKGFAGASCPQDRVDAGRRTPSACTDSRGADSPSVVNTRERPHRKGFALAKEVPPEAADCAGWPWPGPASGASLAPAVDGRRELVGVRPFVPRPTAPRALAWIMRWSLVTSPEERERCCIVVDGARGSQRPVARFDGGSWDDYTYVFADHVELVRREAPGSTVKSVKACGTPWPGPRRRAARPRAAGPTAEIWIISGACALLAACPWSRRSRGLRSRRAAMHISMQQEQFSKAMVRAIATVAGYNVCTYDVDNDSIDLGLAGNRRTGVDVRSPKLDLQLKCTMGDDGTDSSLPFDLSIKNYDDLRDPEVHTPRILVVVCVPNDVPEWLYEQPEATAMRRCAYWFSLRGHPATANTTAQRIRVPRTQGFTVAALTQLMDMVGRGGRP